MKLKRTIFLSLFLLTTQFFYSLPRIDPIIGTLWEGPKQEGSVFTAIYKIGVRNITIKESAIKPNYSWSKPNFTSSIVDLEFATNAQNNLVYFIFAVNADKKTYIILEAANEDLPFQAFLESFKTLYNFFNQKSSGKKNASDRFPAKVGPLIK